MIKQAWQLIRHVVGITAVLLLLTACFGSRSDDSTPASETQEPAPALTGNVKLKCTQACLDRGQCGNNSDGNRVVLGRSNGPAVDNHDLVFAHDANAVVQASTTGVVENIQTAARNEQTFYQIALEDNSKAGWVAGWCVRAP